MLGPIKKVSVVAAVEGLILHPLGQRAQRPIQIQYATHKISSLGYISSPSSLTSVEAYGVIGVLTVTNVAYLITVLCREQVAQIRGIPIYVITGVAIIPLSSQSEARGAIDQAKDSLKKGLDYQGIVTEDIDTSDDEEVHLEVIAEEDQQSSPTSSWSKGDSPVAQREGCERTTSNVAQDVLTRKGQYGRFAERWFSRKGWSTEKRRAQGMSTDDAPKLPSTSAHGEALHNPQPGPQYAKLTYNNLGSRDGTTDAANTLLPKLLRTTRMLLTSRSFFFSYEFDITRRLGEGNTSSEVPLHKSVDELFFWNHHLCQPFTDAGHHAFVLPLMQGFVGQHVFSVDNTAGKFSDAVSDAMQGSKSVGVVQQQVQTCTNITASSDFSLTLISRRSIKRPGLRYLRRGVDDQGDTANTVETEQILSKASWALKEKVYSFTQIRGSIPLFFSQSPYSFKPVPVLQHSSEMNQRAFERHFTNILSRYGNVQIALLVDKKSGEAEIGRKYEESTAKFNSEHSEAGKKLDFEWFDFHAVCRGMKFENVSLLMDALGSKLDEFDETVEIEGVIQKKQTGILRTNCMDCLDRTNVVQSACGQRALEKQLQEEGFKIDLHTDTTTQWFNTLWADNGDQISREYSSTAALKGDYTRTRQRNYRGAINDLGLTLSRYYNNIVNDYFSQAAIDYLLGNVTAQVFDEFEATLGNRDPAISMDKIRASAIETSSKVVIADQEEDLVGEWILVHDSPSIFDANIWEGIGVAKTYVQIMRGTMLTLEIVQMSPHDQNTVRTFPFDECVLLVTDAALYRVKFDWNVEKVSSFERVGLRSITGIIKGTYITSTLATTQSDSERNVGFVIKYKPGKENIARVNTRSLSSAVGSDDQHSPIAKGASTQSIMEEGTPDLKILAFKALAAQDSLTSMDGHGTQGMSEKEVVDSVCEEIRRAAIGEDSDLPGFLVDEEIISLEQARKSTGLIEQWSHSLKKMVWA